MRQIWCFHGFIATWDKTDFVLIKHACTSAATWTFLFTPLLLYINIVPRCIQWDVQKLFYWLRMNWICLVCYRLHIRAYSEITPTSSQGILSCGVVNYNYTERYSLNWQNNYSVCYEKRKANSICIISSLFAIIILKMVLLRPIYRPPIFLTILTLDWEGNAKTRSLAWSPKSPILHGFRCLEHIQLHLCYHKNIRNRI